MIKINQTECWKALVNKGLAFTAPHNPAKRSILSTSQVSLDFNGQHLDQETHTLLLDLANQSQLTQKISDLFSGQLVNPSENKPALHWALRAAPGTSFWLGDHDIIAPIQQTLERMQDISEQIRSQQWVGHSGKPITDVVNLGIGGSHLGPFFCLHALIDLKIPTLNFHFIADFDPLAFSRATASLNPETTLFIVSSKSFTTAETLYNLQQALTWIGHPQAFNQHFIAVTACPDRAAAYGIKHILPIWGWVGGRYSLCSAINLITCISIGYDAFNRLLAGAAKMDEHFRQTPFEQNIPVHLALLGIWTNNFLNIHQLLLLTYAQNLDYLSLHIQQLDMESNGKSIDHFGRPVQYHTGPIIWGGSGTHAQHSYYQLLCQGTHPIAADLISVDAQYPSSIHQLCLAQKEVLSTRGTANDAESGCIRPHAAINHLRLKDTSPETIGALIALYEHKIYTQSVIWQINPFDQPGVESSKRLMQKDFNYA